MQNMFCGDYNINLLKNDEFTTEYLDTLLSLGCCQHINTPTRISTKKSCNSQTLLDHIYSNLEKEKISCKVIDHDISDHQPILSTINCKIKNNYKTIFTIRDMKNFNSPQFLNELENNTSDLLKQPFDNANNLANAFISMYQTIVNKHAPIKFLNKKQQKLRMKPWITPSIQKLIKTKNRLFKRFIKLKTEESKLLYKIARNKLTHSLDISKKAYYTNLFSNSSSDPKMLWKNIEKIIKFKKPKSNQINLIETKGEIITNPSKIADTFNNYFVTVGSNLSKSFSHSCVSNPTALINTNKNSIFLRPISNHEIYKLILELDSNKSTPSTSSSIKLLKMSAKIIVPALTIIFNRCLSEGIFPDIFKTAEVVPIYKSGSKSTISNHRPICLLCPFSKLLEKCIYTRINNFFNTHKLLYDSQFGFRNNCSTENAVLQLHNELLENISKKKISCSIFVDLKKAFDTVNHNILLQKLQKYGIRGIALKLLTNYLSNRNQYTIINGQKSQLKSITHGVPQGSTLGPLLFIIYINDLYLSSNFKVNLFADDAHLLLSNQSPKTLQTKVNTELIKISNWLKTNQLTLNLTKTTYLIITKKTLTHKFHITIDNYELEENFQAKYLGVIIDNKLNWNEHVKYIRNKLASACWALKNLKNYLNPNSLKIYITVYFTRNYNTALVVGEGQPPLT